MNTKIMTSVGCLLLLAAAIAPSVLGHSERGVVAQSLSGYTGAASAGVSGRYVGSAGPAVADYSVGGQGVLAFGGILCDAEVAVDGLFAGNELNVDGPLTVTGGSVPNTWDDGGNGGACHTHHYSTAGFNTFGCQAGAAVNGGTDAGTDVFVGASCDWKEDQGGVSSGTTLQLCIVNSILAISPDLTIVNDVLNIVACVQAFVDCLLDPTCGAQGATQICGADATSDAIIYGYGSATFGNLGTPAGAAQATFPVDPNSVTNPSGTTACAGRSTAGVFVFDAVITDGTVVDVAPALTGELWS